jgi:hypothetical protein
MMPAAGRIVALMTAKKREKEKVSLEVVVAAGEYREKETYSSFQRP